MPAAEVFVHRAAGQYPLGGLDQALLGLHPVFLQQLDGAAGGQVPPLLVGGAQFQRGDQLAVAFQLGLLQYARLAVVGAMGRVGFMDKVQRPINGAWGHAVQLGYRSHLGSSFRAFLRQAVEPLPQLNQRIGRNDFTPPAGHHARPRSGSCRASSGRCPSSGRFPPPCVAARDRGVGPSPVWPD